MMKLKTYHLIAMLFLLMLISGCHMPDPNTPKGMVYTVAVKTAEAEYNRIASLTPPTPTGTATVTPTVTSTPTLVPTETPVPTPTWQVFPAGEAEVLILYYNDVANSASDDPYYQWESDLNVTSKEFEQQVRTLSELGYHAIKISDLVKVLTEGGELPPRPVMFTFDSSKKGQFVNALPILTKYNMVGNLMLYSNQIDTKNCLSSDDVKKFLEAGWELGSVGYNGNHDPANYNSEIGKSKPQLEEKFGVPILAYSYPGGVADAEGRMANYVAKYLYKIAFSKQHVVKQTKNILYFIGRYEIKKGLNFYDFYEMLPWKEGNVSEETINWTKPATPALAATPTP